MTNDLEEVTFYEIFDCNPIDGIYQLTEVLLNYDVPKKQILGDPLNIEIEINKFVNFQSWERFEILNFNDGFQGIRRSKTFVRYEIITRKFEDKKENNWITQFVVRGCFQEKYRYHIKQILTMFKYNLKNNNSLYGGTILKSNTEAIHIP